MEVTVAYNYLAGDRVVSEDESVMIGINHFEVGGHWIDFEAAMLSNDGPFLTLTLMAPEGGGPTMDKAAEEIAALRSELTPADWLEGTTEDVLILPVSSIKWAELVPA